MKKSNIKGFIMSASMFAVGITFTGCNTPKNVSYFQDNASVIAAIAEQPIKARPEDKLSIVVKSKDPQISEMFNLPTYTTRVGQNTPMSGTGSSSNTHVVSSGEGSALYTVDPQGCIDFPVLGKLKIEGMTRSEIAGFVKGELMGRDLVKDPTVSVEFVNTGINILGEIKNPGRYDINKDHLTIMDAIALGGDLTILGQRENVKVIRQESDGTHIYELDLTNLDKLSKSPAFYLQQDDVVYIEPNDMRKRATIVNGNNLYNTGFWISVASLITTAVTTVGVFINK